MNSSNENNDKTRRDDELEPTIGGKDASAQRYLDQPTIQPNDADPNDAVTVPPSSRNGSVSTGVDSGMVNSLDTTH